MRALVATAPSNALTFDVCHGALVWRALVIVNVGLGLGVLASSTTAWDALARSGPLLLVGLVGTALWLAGVCAAQHHLPKLSPLQRRMALALWGATVAAMGYGLNSWMLREEAPLLRWVSAVCIGAALAAVLSIWIEQRSRVQRPVHADARLAELQSRMRPHFLFNTLNTATALVRVDAAAAETMLEDLSDLFRAALNEAKTATLGDEVAVAKQYLAIEQRRFGQRMQVTWDLDPKADGAPVPSLVLQPLVENAVHHGVESLNADAWIHITTRAVRGMAHIDIENNVGSKTPTGSGMALANVRERLRLLHDLDGRFDARQEGDRFIVRVGVPLKAAVA
jgi:two-component system, LytTR family, sensor histidine kinase AlgZ